MRSTVFSSATVQEFFTVVLKLRNPEECREFFADLCTTSEVLAFADRLNIACLVQRGLPYRTISSITGSSSATIARIAHALKYGTGTLARIAEPTDSHCSSTFLRSLRALRTLLP